jgi:hypothetical protein
MALPSAREEPDERACLERFLPKPAVLAVADVQADQLVATAAGTEVLRSTRQGRGTWSQGENHGDRLHLLAGLAIEVDLTRLGVGECLTAGGRGAHSVELLRVHGGED